MPATRESVRPRAALKASDGDREQTAERLRFAAAEGRLLTDELDERLHAVFSARTYGELDAVLSDLPSSPPPASAHPPSPARLRPLLIAAAVLAIVLVMLVAARVSLRAGESTAVPNQLAVPSAAVPPAAPPAPKAPSVKPGAQSSSPKPSPAG